jgi:hypothetical protein
MNNFLFIKKKMTPYDIILQDLFIEEEIQRELPEIPYTYQMNNESKIKITYRCLLRAQRLKQRTSALVFAYFLGQLIEEKELVKKQIRKIMTEHYYIMSVRTYYIFESNPRHIFATRNTTVNLIMQLKQQDMRRLTVEI